MKRALFVYFASIRSVKLHKFHVNALIEADHSDNVHYCERALITPTLTGKDKTKEIPHFLQLLEIISRIDKFLHSPLVIIECIWMLK